MPDVANFKEYSELKSHLDEVGESADPGKVAVARDALKRYESQYLGGDNILNFAPEPSLLAPDTGPRERGESYQPPLRLSGNQTAQIATDNPQLSDASLRAFYEPDAPVAPPSKTAKPPLRLISPAPSAQSLSSADIGRIASGNPQIPDAALRALEDPSYRSQVTAQQMPTHVGGGTEVFPDAPVSRFIRDVAPELQRTMEPLDFAAMMEQPQASKQYRAWIDQTYNERSDAALARGHSAKRLPAGLLDPSYVKDAPWEDRLEEGANRSTDALFAASAGALNVGGIGAGTALAGAVGGKEAALTLQESEQRHPEIAAASGFRAAASPVAPANLAARGINSALLAGGAKIAPSLTGFMPFIGRTAAAGVAGGLSATGESVARTAIEDSATGKPFEIDWGNAGKQGLLGTALGSAFHIAGEGFGALNKSTEKTYETELRDARRVGAEPGLGGVKLAPGSPVQEIENARVAQELPSGAGVAAGRVAPKIADEGARLKAEVFERAEAETSAAYDRLARGRAARDAPAPPKIADVPRLMPRPTPKETARHIELLKRDHAYVPPEQAEAVRAHAFGSDDVFKRLQRGEDTNAIAADLQQRTGRTTAGDHVASAKTMLPELERFMADTPPTPGTVYRGIVVDEATAQKLLAQTEFGMDGVITSASRDPMVARSFIGRGLSGEAGATHGVTFKLKHSTGRGIEDLAEQGSGYGKTGVEKEVLLPGTARFKVTGRYEDPTQPNNYIIEAEEIGGRNTMAGPEPLPRFSSESDPLPRFETEAMSNQLDEIGLEGTKFSPEFNPQKLAAVKGHRDPASPVEVAIYPDEGNGPIFHLSDGRHRLAVAQERGDAELEALIRHYDNEGNITSTERRMVPIRGVGPRPRPPFGDSFFPDDPARSLGPVRNLQPPHGAHPTLAPGPSDAEADAFGRIARAQGENQASLLGIQQAAKRGAHVTPDPVRVSTAPVVKHLLGILKKHNPDGGQIPFIPEDDPLRKQFPNMMRTEYVTLEEAKRRLTADPTGWIESPATGRELGMFEAPPQTVLLVTPRDLDAPSFDIMVKALDDKAKFNKELSDGDPRYKELSKAAHVARSGFPGLNELKGRQADEFGKTDQLLEHAGMQVGAGGDVANWSKGSSSQQKSVENAVKQFKQQGNRLTDDALRTVAKLGGFEAELNQIPGQVAVEKLEKTMRTGENLPASDAGLVRRGYQVGRLHLYPHIKALGGTPAPEKELQAMAEALSPQLKRALRAMRVSPVAKPRVQDISGLTSRIGLKGGAMGQRAAAAIEESGLTEEDVTNLLRMKKAAGAN